MYALGPAALRERVSRGLSAAVFAASASGSGNDSIKVEAIAGAAPQEPETLLTLHESIWGVEVDSFRKSASVLRPAVTPPQRVELSNPFAFYSRQDLGAVLAAHERVVAADTTDYIPANINELPDSVGGLHDIVRRLVEGNSEIDGPNGVSSMKTE
jgi:hypothetical protein